MENNKWKLFAMGDFLTTKNYNNCIFSNKLLNIIKRHDIKFCNYEAPVIQNKTPISKAGPHLEQKEKSIKQLLDAGFNIVSLANNHIWDYGDAGLKNTINLLNSNNILHVGAGQNFRKAYMLKTKEIKGFKVGFLAFCESEFGAYTNKESQKYGYAWINHDLVDEIIKKNRSKVDILILSSHAGVEEMPLPLPEWRSRYKELCDLGVDIIIGHHPHVPQGWEEYKNSLIFYSLGNSFFDYGSTEFPFKHSYSISITFENKDIKSYSIYPIFNTGKKLRLYENKEYKDYLNELSYFLTDDNKYIFLIKSQVLYLFETRYNNYFYNYTLSLNRKNSILSNLKRLLVKLFKKDNKKSRELLLYHLYKIESHRWTIERALYLKNEEGIDQVENEFLDLLKRGNLLFEKL